MMNQLKSIYNSPFKSSYSHPIASNDSIELKRCTAFVLPCRVHHSLHPRFSSVAVHTSAGICVQSVIHAEMYRFMKC